MSKDKFFSKEGFTLVETIAAITILGIVLITFLNIFGYSFGNILSMGRKDLDLTQVSELFELIYLEQEIKDGLTRSEIEDIISPTSFNYEIEENQEIMTDIFGFKVTLFVATRIGQNQDLLPFQTFVRKRG